MPLGSTPSDRMRRVAGGVRLYRHGVRRRGGQHDPAGRAGSAVVVRDDEQGSAVVTTEHASETATVDLDLVHRTAALSHPSTPATRHACVPDRPFGIRADVVGAEPDPKSAHTRRSANPPSSVIVHAVNRSACDSATTSVSSPTTTIPSETTRRRPLGGSCRQAARRPRCPACGPPTAPTRACPPTPVHRRRRRSR